MTTQHEGIRELTDEELVFMDICGGISDSNDAFAIGVSIGGAVISGAGVVAGIAFAASPLGLAVGFGLGMAGLFTSSAGLAASLI